MAETRLSLSEREDLAKLEAIIEKGLPTFTGVGCALLSIRDRRLYRATHDTWQDYCLDRWVMTKTHANRLIDAHQVVRNLTPIGVAPPANEAQARELARLPAPQQGPALEDARAEAAAEGRRMTAADARAAVERAARAAGIDPTTFGAGPPLSDAERVEQMERNIIARAERDDRLESIKRIINAIKKIRAALGQLDAGEQVMCETWLNDAPGFLNE